MQITTLSELTIDGKLSLGPTASSKDLFGFYGDELKRWFHAQRASNDAIMVGSRTVVADDPELTVRHAPGPNPLRIIPSSSAKLPLDAKILNDGLPTIVAVSHMAGRADVAALAAKPNVDVVICGETSVDLVALLNVLEGRGVNTMIVEGGSRLLHSLHKLGLVNRIVIKHIPVITGSMQAPSYMHPYMPHGAFDLTRWRLVDCFSKSGVAVTIYEPLTEGA